MPVNYLNKDNKKTVNLSTEFLFEGRSGVYLPDEP